MATRHTTGPIPRPIKSPDEAYIEALRRLRHASFALAAASSSFVVEDRDMAEVYLKEAARYFVLCEQQSGRTPSERGPT